MVLMVLGISLVEIIIKVSLPIGFTVVFGWGLASDNELSIRQDFIATGGHLNSHFIALRWVVSSHGSK